MDCFNLNKLELGPDIRQGCKLVANNITYEAGDDSDILSNSRLRGRSIIKIGYFSCAGCIDHDLQDMIDRKFTSDLPEYMMPCGSAKEILTQRIVHRIGNPEVCGAITSTET
jgi:hypothetical protein